jgi:hypothetical protein
VASWALTCGDEIRREKQTRHQQRDKAFILLQKVRYDFSKSGSNKQKLLDDREKQAYFKLAQARVQYITYLWYGL